MYAHSYKDRLIATRLVPFPAGAELWSDSLAECVRAEIE